MDIVERLRGPMQIGDEDRAADEIERLRAELAEGNRLMNSLAERSNAWRNDAEQAQAREATLRAVLAPFVNIVAMSSGRIPSELLSFAEWHELCKALSLPQDDSALKAALKQARIEGMEKLARLFEEMPHVAKLFALSVADKIRAEIEKEKNNG